MLKIHEIFFLIFLKIKIKIVRQRINEAIKQRFLEIYILPPDLYFYYIFYIINCILYPHILKI